jgi:MFS family permease
MTSVDAPRMTAGQRLLSIGLVLGVTLVAFEVTAVVTAMPTITDQLHGDSLYGLAVAVYTLANMVALVAAGEFADRRGPAVPYVVSISTFIVGLVVAAAAPTMVWVVVGRTLQGAGSGGLQPIAYTLVSRAFPAARQARMFAILSAGWVLPSLFAPALSGWVVDTFGWRWVFLGIIPFAVVVGALSVQPMRAFAPTRSSPAEPSRIPLAVAAAAGVGAFATGVQMANPLAAISVSVVGAAVAVRALRRLLPAGIGRLRLGFPAIVACRIIATAAFLGADSFIPLAADRIHHVRPLLQGMTIIGAALAWTGGQWVRSRHPVTRPDLAVRNGFLVMLLGLVLVVPVLWPGWPLWATFLGWAVGGFGMGLLFNPTTVAAMGYATSGTEGRVSSQLSLGDAFGFSLMGGLGGGAVALADHTSFSIRGALGVNFALAIVLAIVGAVAASRIRPSSQP